LALSLLPATARRAGEGEGVSVWVKIPTRGEGLLTPSYKH